MVSFRDPGRPDTPAAPAGENPAVEPGEKIAPVTYLRGAGHTPEPARTGARSGADSWFGSDPEPAAESTTSGSNSESERAPGARSAPRKRAAGHLRAVGRDGAVKGATAGINHVEQDDDEPAEQIADPEAVESLLVRKLARRSLSEAEVLAFAVQEGLTAAQANTILDRLRDLGYVDDRALAEQLKHSLSERKGQSKAVVARAMSGRSIDRDIITEVLDDIEQDDELGVATELARKRASQMSGLDKQTLERRLTGFLARRGYPGNIVREAIAPVLTGRSSSPSSTVRFR
ncbi:regulatory protein RecX [Mycetocola zhujimingii]|uniref:regulatory protein RecX n=1 Tax=Mycetocola zhujimingii TaxID=2079792 RepID=UPI000D3C3CF9|nr:regulatory protein RecX [Mycetocola zhujimingii]AWB86035.1 hypothetical protein C3E77_05000 [Mycetocola zhujimingii]